ncbi:hypothetical protein [Thermoflexus sp.]|uniref:hypothetical protein n=1 Tax=Thermoflexus sp. TaxID=1969742 RepID=UPI0025CBB9A6|nr:hypothetical protein [Thermoflexus sp.]MDW8180756.1 hypothetical protein [Anaerolineae bacterium]MCS6965016.1 hypothetical protein [Thermoflexus sp.]MCS7351301.1 hypothetical protein [Thermoflexus sp.]MCX7691039.1 hypothetical protein [Thermoflexus sp.]MDW8185661.1 hypothetical protein [Anaerolineae bacterium]
MKPEDELTFIQEGMGIIEDYLASDLVYWPLRPFSATFPSFSLGGLLESLRRLEALQAQLPPRARSDLELLKARLERVREAQRDRYQQKLERELSSRLDAWAWYLEDYERHPEEAAASYPAQVHIRLKIDLLLEEGERLGLDMGKIQSRLRALDQTLRRNWTPGPFLWEKALQAAFPPDRFWWLYGRPRGR